jgi:hypothetical protein
MNTEHRWNYTDRREPENSEKNLRQCHFVHHKSPRTGPSANPGLRGDRPQLTTWVMARPQQVVTADVSFNSLTAVFHRPFYAAATV